MNWENPLKEKPKSSHVKNFQNWFLFVLVILLISLLVVYNNEDNDRLWKNKQREFKLPFMCTDLKVTEDRIIAISTNKHIVLRGDNYVDRTVSNNEGILETTNRDVECNVQRVCENFSVMYADQTLKIQKGSESIEWKNFPLTSGDKMFIKESGEIILFTPLDSSFRTFHI